RCVSATPSWHAARSANSTTAWHSRSPRFHLRERISSELFRSRLRPHSGHRRSPHGRARPRRHVPARRAGPRRGERGHARPADRRAARSEGQWQAYRPRRGRLRREPVRSADHRARRRRVADRVASFGGQGRSARVRGPGLMFWYILKLLVLLPLIGLMIWGSLKLAQRLQGRFGAPQGGTRAVRIVETTMLSPTLRLAVIEFHGREILVST